jgi:hypothetical protein
VLHPRGVIEAENYSAISAPSATTESNNEWNSSGTDRPNGGLSIVGLYSGDSLQYAGVVPPEPPVAPGPLTNVFNYALLLRTGNYSGGATTVSITISSPGFTTWTGSVSLPPTGDKHEYVVVSTSSTSPIPLKSGVGYSVQLAFQGGPCSIDDMVLVSGGVMQ